MNAVIVFRTALVLAAAIAAAGACGGGSGDVDAAVQSDATTEDPCPLPPGTGHVLMTLTILPADQGFDLDGDSVIDNELGNLPQAAKDTAHTGFNDGLAQGATIVLPYVTDWTDPPTPDDADVTLHVFGGHDADEPGDPTNNFSGEGEFYARVENFDLNCESTQGSDEGSISGGLLTARRSEWTFEIPGGTGTLTFSDAIVEIQYSDDFGTGSGAIGSVMSLCALSSVPFPGEIPGTILDAFANDSTIGSFVNVDVDVDGDGLEQVVGDGVTILECIDGDGTVIEGRDCPCHPAIVDGYSSALGVEFVAARVIGVR